MWRGQSRLVSIVANQAGRTLKRKNKRSTSLGLAHCDQLHYIVPNGAHPMLEPFHGLEHAGYSMLSNFDEGIPYTHESVRNLNVNDL